MSGETPIRQIRRFGIFEVDFRRKELLRNGLQIKLRDQSFLLLAALLEVYERALRPQLNDVCCQASRDLWN